MKTLTLAAALLFSAISICRAQLQFVWVDQFKRNNSKGTVKDVSISSQNHPVWIVSSFYSSNNARLSSIIFGNQTNSYPTAWSIPDSMPSRYIAPEKYVVNYNASYLAGAFRGPVDFDFLGNGNENRAGNGLADGFIAKYKNGDVDWVKTLGTTTNEAITCLDVKNNLIFIAGYYNSNLTFDEDLILEHKGEGDIFIACLDIDGNTVWVNTIAGAGAEYTPVISADSLGNVIVACQSVSSAVRFTSAFTPAITINPTQPFAESAYLACYNAIGQCVWANAFVSDNSIGITGITKTPQGNIAVAGYYKTNTGIDFDPATNTQTLYSNNSTDVFVAAYTTAGNYLWAKKQQSFTEENEKPKAIVCDKQGVLYVASNREEVFFNSLFGLYYTIYPHFITSYMPDGNIITTYNMDENNAEGGINDMAIDEDNNLYIGGSLNGDVDIGLGNESFIVNGYNGNAYLAKYTLPYIATGIKENSPLIFTLYPNPATNLLNINLPVNSGKTTARIYTADGRLVKQCLVTTNTIDISGFTNGLYTISLEDKNGMIGRQKFVVQY